MNLSDTLQNGRGGGGVCHHDGPVGPSASSVQRKISRAAANRLI